MSLPCTVFKILPYTVLMLKSYYFILSKSVNIRKRVKAPVSVLCVCDVCLVSMNCDVVVGRHSRRQSPPRRQRRRRCLRHSVVPASVPLAADHSSLLLMLMFLSSSRHHSDIVAPLCSLLRLLTLAKIRQTRNSLRRRCCSSCQVPVTTCRCTGRMAPYQHRLTSRCSRPPSMIDRHA